MRNLNKVMDEFAQALADGLPGRYVTRTVRELSQFTAEQYDAGVICIYPAGVRDSRPEGPRERVVGEQVIMVEAFIRLPEDAPGQAIDEAEFDLMDEIDQVAVSFRPTCGGKPKFIRAEQSGQVDHPLAGVRIEYRRPAI